MPGVQAKEASEDFMRLQKIDRLKGPEMALEAATELETEAMAHRFRRQLNVCSQKQTKLHNQYIT